MIAELEIKSEEKPAAAENAHLIGKFIGNATGATLIVVGSVHGNEAGGAIALRKVTRLLQILREKLRGRVYFLAGNTRTLAKGVRFVDADLNRHWSAAIRASFTSRAWTKCSSGSTTLLQSFATRAFRFIFKSESTKTPEQL